MNKYESMRKKVELDISKTELKMGWCWLEQMLLFCGTNYSYYLGTNDTCCALFEKISNDKGKIINKSMRKR